MEKIDYSKPSKVHFIGIGGISMSGLAKMLLSRGFQITGSDSKRSNLTDELSSLGAKVYYGQTASNIESDVDYVVYTAAVHPDNPEYMEASSRKIPMLTRAELLGQIMDNYKDSIAISGTNGKTTTTSMISQILLENQSDPTLLVGGIYPPINGNLRMGKSNYFVSEACEYTNSFLQFYPKYAIILNIEEDHLDFFKDINDIRRSFRSFAEHLPMDGVLVMHDEITDPEEITKGLSCHVFTYGFHEESDYVIQDVVYNELGYPSFTVLHNNVKSQPIQLQVPGNHNVLNATSAYAIADNLCIPSDVICAGLSSFRGTNRRIEIKGKKDGVTIIDDYAHNPIEIETTLKAVRRFPHKSLWCVFQPHTYSRTKELFDKFVKVLSGSDKVVLADIYASRETDNLGVSSAQLAEAIRKNGTECYYFPSFEEIENFLIKNFVNGDLLITMGAGDVVKISENILKK